MTTPSSEKYSKNILDAKYKVYPVVLWLTGLSGAGKTTISKNIYHLLKKNNDNIFYLNGDFLRKGINKDLGYSKKDRNEGARRVSEIAKILISERSFIIVDLISPFNEDRKKARYLIGNDLFVELYCQCPLEVCKIRDPKGLYKMARGGHIDQFTGVDSPYEHPEMADIIINTNTKSIKQCLTSVVSYLGKKNYIELCRRSQ